MIQNTFTDVDKTESYSGQEPVTLADAKKHLRVDFTDDDTLITAMITASRKAIENYCHISLVPKTITLWLKAKDVPQSNYAQPFQVREQFNEFELPYGPVRSVDSVTSIGSDGTTMITCALNSDYYLTGNAFNSIKISNNFDNNVLVYDAGYLAGTVPPELWLAILNELSYRYEFRGDSTNRYAKQNIGICETAEALAKSHIRRCWI